MTQGCHPALSIPEIHYGGQKTGNTGNINEIYSTGIFSSEWLLI